MQVIITSHAIVLNSINFTKVISIRGFLGIYATFSTVISKALQQNDEIILGVGKGILGEQFQLKIFYPPWAGIGKPNLGRTILLNSRGRR